MQIPYQIPVEKASTTAPPALVVPVSFLALIYRLVIAIDVLLIVATLLWDLGVDLPRGFGQLDLRSEGRPAVWYSSSLLLLAGGAALLVGYSGTGRGVGSARTKWAWMTVAGVFLVLSADELLEFHEGVGRWFSSRVAEVPVLLGPFAWVLVLSPFIVAFVAVLVGLIHHVLSANRRSHGLAIAALLCWVGVLEAELLEAQMDSLHIYRSVQGTLEEGLEIAGSSLFLIAFCEYLRRRDS